MKDPRLITVEISIALLHEVPEKLLRGIDLKGLRSKVQRIVYSFMTLEDLKEQGMLDPIGMEGKILLNKWVELKDRSRKPGDFLNAAKVRFAGLTLANLPARVGREPMLYNGADCFWGTIIKVEPFNHLKATLVDAKERFDIVTNMDVKENDVLAFAILPPRRFGNYVSEGMFIEAEPKRTSGEQATPTDKGRGAIESVLREEAARLKVRI